MSLLLRRRMLLSQNQYKGYNSLISPPDFSYKYADTTVKYDYNEQVYTINGTQGLSVSLCKLPEHIPIGTPYTMLAEVVNDDFEVNLNSFVLGLYTNGTWAGSNLNLTKLSQDKKIFSMSSVTTKVATDVLLFNNYFSGIKVKNLKIRFLVYFGTDTVTEWEPYVE